MNDNPTPTPATVAEEGPSIRDVWEVARLPGLLAVVTAAVTWLIWYYTSTPCTLELAARIGCNPAEIARFIDVDVFGRMLTYSAITAAAGGVWNYNMFTRMRAEIAAEKQRADAERQRADAERQRADSAVQEVVEYLRQAEAERRSMMQQNAELNRAMLAALTELTAEIGRLRQARNGDGAAGH